MTNAANPSTPAPEPGRFPNLRGDLFGGITAGIVALPLALGFGVASGMGEAGAAAGLYGAIAVGILAALFGGTPSQVSGPTGPLTVVVAGLAATLGDPAAVFLAVILGGAIQIGLGVLRLGGLIRYVPYPVVSGFMSGIGVIIILLQIPFLLGHAPVKSPLDAVLGVPGFLPEMSWAALLLGAATIAVVYLSPRITRKVPGTLVALISMTLLANVMGLKVTTISAIPQGLPLPKLPSFDPALLRSVIPAALIIAILASVDSLLTSLVADRITSTQHASNRELIGQGIGNMVSGMIGGLPGAGATMRTVVNVQSGGRTRLSGAVHGVLLLAILLGLAPLAEAIPMAVLAGILVTVGVGILDYRGLKDILRAPRGDSAVMLLVLVLTVFVDLMWAVAAGVILSSLLFVKSLGDHPPAIRATRTGAFQGDEDETPSLELDHVLHVRGPLFFGNVTSMRAALEQVPHGANLELDLSRVAYIDQSSAYALSDLIGDLRAREVHVRLTSLHGQPREVLATLGTAPGLVPADDITFLEEAPAAAAGASQLASSGVGAT